MPSRQHHGGCLVIAPLLAASASRHLAGEAANLSRLLPVRAQRAPTRKTPARRPYRCPGQVMCSITPEADKSQYRLPLFDMRPSLCFPPLECWRGTSPIHAANSRPDLNAAGSGIVAAMVEAVIGPMP